MIELTADHAGLAESLTRIAASPDQSTYLHEVLGVYCHQSRNILHNLKMTLYLSQTPGDGGPIWGETGVRYRSLERTFERLQAICQPITLHPVRLPFRLLVEDRQSTWEQTLDRTGRRLVVEPPGSEPPVPFDPQRLGQALDELVAWRAVVATSPDLRLTWSTEADQMTVRWDEVADGPPTRPSCGAPTPETWSIPYLSRLMCLHGGVLATEAAPWSLSLRWPLSVPP